MPTSCSWPSAGGLQLRWRSLLCLGERDQTLVLVSQECGIGREPFELCRTWLSRLQGALDLPPGRQYLFSFV
jgi:hypothetical protein